MSFQNCCNEHYMETHGCLAYWTHPIGPRGNVNIADHQRLYPSICLAHLSGCHSRRVQCQIPDMILLIIVC